MKIKTVVIGLGCALGIFIWLYQREAKKEPPLPKERVIQSAAFVCQRQDRLLKGDLVTGQYKVTEKDRTWTTPKQQTHLWKIAIGDHQFNCQWRTEGEG